MYSTCTFNPIEDEAVVAAVLRATKGAMHLVDVSTALPQLKRLPGLSTWKVRPLPAPSRPRHRAAVQLCAAVRQYALLRPESRSRRGSWDVAGMRRLCHALALTWCCVTWGGAAQSARLLAGVQVRDKGGWHEEWEAVRERVAEGKAQLDPSMFPPPTSADLPLHLCMRFLPHHQDTGGFFVAVLEKTRECADLEVPTQDHRGKGKRGKKVRLLLLRRPQRGCRQVVTARYADSGCACAATVSCCCRVCCAVQCCGVDVKG